ncbi:MAG TPA: diphthine--ammonia ligase [Sulfolobales archaeon]|nr:diphthine--ammonia ligase [Sulfolobales archaeon]
MKVAVASWSGGKDSYLALHSAFEKGLRILYTIHMHVEDIISYHGPLGIIMAQQASLNTIGIMVRTTWSEYEKHFKEILASLKRSGVEAAVFGDIYIEDHRRWVERVCREVGIEALEPLWGFNSLENVRKALNMGVKALIVRVHDREPLSKYVGRVLDGEVIEDLIREGIDPSGEHGEYHTVVLDAPLFRYRIEVIDGRTEILSGRMAGKSHRYRIFIPTKYRVVDKHKSLKDAPQEQKLYSNGLQRAPHSSAQL